MNTEDRCTIVIPVYNEEMAIRDTLERLKKVIAAISGWRFDIICVNDGSSDGTADILSSIKEVIVINHIANRGYGAALKTGLDSCKTEWVFIADADGTYPLEQLSVLLDEAKKGADMVVGARKGLGITLNPIRQCGRWIIKMMAYSLTGVRVPDLNSGMRVFKHSLYREFRNLLPMGFSFTTTITLASLYTNKVTKYVTIDYAKRIGKSSIRPVRDFLGFSMLIVRIASYFEPLRFFLPLAFTFLIAGVLKALRDFILLDHIGGLAATIFLVGVQIFVTGILADVMVRRSGSSGNIS